MGSQDLGKLLLRLLYGGLLLFHGVSKIRHGVSGIADSVVEHGLPRPFAYGVYVGEVLAPAALILGWFSRPAAAIIAFNMGVAVFLSHAGQLFQLGKSGGYALELQALYLIGALALVFLGGGRWALRQDAA
jgi:putative oxidoreductase